MARIDVERFRWDRDSHRIRHVTIDDLMNTHGEMRGKGSTAECVVITVTLARRSSSIGLSRDCDDVAVDVSTTDGNFSS
jgi:hypothetical protein